MGERNLGKLAPTPERRFMADEGTFRPLEIVQPEYPALGIWESGWTKVFKGVRDPDPTKDTTRFADQSFWFGGSDASEAKVGDCDWPGCNGIGIARSYFQ